MEKLLLVIITFVFFMLPIKAVKKIEANPINIAVMLVEESDTAKIASTLDYYGYTRQIPPSEGWRASFTHPNGSILCYKLTGGEKFPAIEVKTKTSTKEKVQILNSLNFHKQDNSYERKSVGSTTECVLGSHGSLILTCRIVPRK